MYFLCINAVHMGNYNFYYSLFYLQNSNKI